MEQQKSTIQDKQQLVLTQIKETPFNHATDGTENYITCGKYILRTDKKLEETKEWVKEKPWDLIGLLIESFVHEINNNEK